MSNFADRLIASIVQKGNPCVVGLDPRLELIPNFISRPRRGLSDCPDVCAAITNFHKMVLDTVAPLVPAVKLQIAFYEQYGLPGLQAFVETIRAAKERGLIVIADAKRGDISSTAEAYAGAFLGRVKVFGHLESVFDVDCMTVTPFLGRDSMEPFVEACQRYDKGIFILVKTSNAGSVDLQDQRLAASGEFLYERLAGFVEELGRELIGNSGYSSIGAVVGATFPDQAKCIRGLLRQAIILVPGYGAQGGTAKDVMDCFNGDRLGAVVNASRSITYAHKSADITEVSFVEGMRSSMNHMITEITSALQQQSISNG